MKKGIIGFVLYASILTVIGSQAIFAATDENDQRISESGEVSVPAWSDREEERLLLEPVSEDVLSDNANTSWDYLIDVYADEEVNKPKGWTDDADREDLIAPNDKSSGGDTDELLVIDENDDASAVSHDGTTADEQAVFEEEEQTEDAIENFSEVDVIANNWDTNASLVDLNTAYVERLSDKEEEDVYKFELTEPGYIHLTFSHAYIADSNKFWSALFYNSDMKEIVMYDFYGTDVSVNTRNLGLPTGTFYMVIKCRYNYRGYRYSPDDYTFTVNFNSSSTWESEFNDSAPTADQITLNTDWKGSLCHDEDVDWYRYTLTQPGFISLSFSHDYIANANYYWRIYFYNSSMSELIYYDYTGTSLSSITANIGLAKGDYYIMVQDRPGYRGWGYTGIDYTMHMNFTPSNTWESEFNDSASSADTIAPGQDYYGSLRHSDDVDWYRIVLDPADEVILEFEHPQVNSNNILWQMTLYSSSMRELASRSIPNGTTSSVYRFSLPAELTYIKIESPRYDYYSSRDYNIKLTLHNHNYVKRVTPATMSGNGKIEEVCSCEDVKSSSVIYGPKSVTLSSTSYSYNGKQKTPSVTVVGNDDKIISSANYTVTYPSPRSKVGRYVVKITFKGNYSGTVSKAFRINPAKTSISKLSAKSKGFSVTWKKQTKEVTGYQIQYSTSSSFSGKKTETISKSSASSKTFKGLKSKKKYYVRIRTYKTVSGKTYYSSWSSSKSVTTKK